MLLYGFVWFGRKSEAEVKTINEWKRLCSREWKRLWSDSEQSVSQSVSEWVSQSVSEVGIELLGQLKIRTKIYMKGHKERNQYCVKLKRCKNVDNNKLKILRLWPIFLSLTSTLLFYDRCLTKMPPTKNKKFQRSYNQFTKVPYGIQNSHK